MIYFPMVKGIRKIEVKDRSISDKSLCANAARELWLQYGWGDKPLMRYTKRGIIHSSAALKAMYERSV